MEPKTPQELFDENTKLIWSVIVSIRGTHQMDEDDLFQELSIPYWRCCQGFDPAREVKFSTYACISMKRYVRQIIYEQTLPIRVPGRNNWALFNDLQKKIMSISDEKFVEPSYKPGDPDEKPYAYELMLRCINNVPGKGGKILRMWLVDAMKPIEIAKALGTTRQGIDQYLNTAFFRAFGKERRDVFPRGQTGIHGVVRSREGKADVEKQRNAS